MKCRYFNFNYSPTKLGWNGLLKKHVERREDEGSHRTVFLFISEVIKCFHVLHYHTLDSPSLSSLQWMTISYGRHAFWKEEVCIATRKGFHGVKDASWEKRRRRCWISLFLKVYFIDYAIIVPIFLPLPPSAWYPLLSSNPPPLVHVQGSCI